MEARLLTSLGKIAGLGGIAFGVVLILFQGVLQEHLQVSLGKQQAFVIILVLMILTFGIAAIGMIACLISGTTNAEEPVPEPRLRLLAALSAAVIVAAVIIGMQAKPDPVPPPPVPLKQTGAPEKPAGSRW